MYSDIFSYFCTQVTWVAIIVEVIAVITQDNYVIVSRTKPGCGDEKIYVRIR